MKAGLGCGGKIRILIIASVCAFFLLGLPLDGWARLSSQKKSPVSQTFARMPVYFVENKGQMDPFVRYYHQGPGHEMFFTPSGIMFSITGSLSSSHVSLTPQGMSESSELIGSAPLSTKVNIFRGNNPVNWRTDIPTYGSVIYQGVWPKVDLKFYGNNPQLEYYIIINANGDTSKVVFRYDGIKEARLTEEGDLALGLETGAALIQKCPVAYQVVDGKRIERQANFRIIQAPSKGKPDAPLIYGFDVAAYDSGYELIIDPVIVFSTCLGGSKADYGIEVGADAEGNTIVAGITRSTDFPTTSGACNPESGGGQTDIFIAKVDKSGSSLIYSTYLGGSDIELDGVSEGEMYNFGLAVDRNGNAYVSCNTRSSDFPTTTSAYSRTLKGIADALAVKLNPTGNSLVYSTYLGGSGWEETGGIAVDEDGNAYIAGDTNSADFPTTAGAYRRIPFGDDDIFVTKLSPDGGVLVYSTYLGGTHWDESTAIAVDKDRNAYILGGGDSSDYPTTDGAFDTSYNDSRNYDIYLTKINATGSGLVYSTFLGGRGQDWAEGMAIDDQGSVYVSGETGSSDFPVISGAFDTIFDASGEKNGFVSKFSKDGSNLVYSTFLGSGDGAAMGTMAFGISIDATHSAIVTGITGSSSFPTSSDAFSRTLYGSTDGFIAKLSRHGDKLLYSTLLGGTGTEGFEGALGNTIDVYNQVHVTGLTNSADFPTKLGIQPHYGGGDNDAFVVKISGLASTPAATTFLAPVYLLLEDEH
jgi:hypothetical protein